MGRGQWADVFSPYDNLYSPRMVETTINTYTIKTEDKLSKLNYSTT